MSKPTIVMVPGAWHRPEIYTGVVEYLSQYGYPTVCLPLPSVGAEPPHEDFSGDVKGIRNCVTQLVSKDENVVLVVHSGTSLPGSEALKGLGKREREGNGLNGGVIRYVVMSGFAMPEGFQPAAKEDYSRFPEWMKMDHEVRDYYFFSSIFWDSIRCTFVHKSYSFIRKLLSFLLEGNFHSIS
jgi:hypothetical protein